jgi:transcription initiation factor TFIIE subunit beta
MFIPEDQCPEGLNLINLSSFFIKALQNEIIYISRPVDKKKIVFYNDKTAALSVDEEFQKLWRSVAVESMDDQKIEEYLEKQVSNTYQS